jgi:hypothetical protein
LFSLLGRFSPPVPADYLPVAGSVLLNRELGGTAAARREGHRSVSRTTGVHELAGLLLSSQLLNISRYLTGSGLLYWTRFLDRSGLLYISLRLGLGDSLPGHLERERADYQHQKRQSDKERSRNQTPISHSNVPLTPTSARILPEPGTTKPLLQRLPVLPNRS